MPWFSRLGAGHSPKRLEFNSRLVLVGFVVGKVELGQVFLRVLLISLVAVISIKLFAHLLLSSTLYNLRKWWQCWMTHTHCLSQDLRKLLKSSLPHGVPIGNKWKIHVFLVYIILMQRYFFLTWWNSIPNRAVSFRYCWLPPPSVIVYIAVYYKWSFTGVQDIVTKWK
jgi:hypothetical protein